MAADSAGLGWSVAISGETAVVADETEDVYVFARSGSRWHQQASLPAPRGADLFGWSVATSGSFAVVGDPGASVAGHSNAGAAYIYARSRGTWHLRATIDDPYPHQAAFDSFGWSVAMSGATAVVGSAAGRGVRRAFVYVQSRARWHLQAVLADSRSEGFGWSVAISGATAVIGAYVGGSDSAGVVYVFTRLGDRWHRAARLTNPGGVKNDQFGYAVAVSAARILVGAPDKGQRRCGTAFEFASARGEWHYRAKIVNPGCAAGDQFGAAVAQSASTAVIGAPGKDKGAGAAYTITIPDTRPRRTQSFAETWNV